MNRNHYWLYYSSLDFSAFLILAPIEVTQKQVEKEYQRDVCGPYATKKEARDAGIAKANGDIDEFRRMKEDIKGKVSIYSEGDEDG